MCDAYLNREGNLIRIGTSGIEKTLRLSADGAFTMVGLRHKATGKEYVQPGPVAPDEFFITVDGEAIGVAYPGLPVIQEWTEYENNSGAPMRVTRPSLFVQRLLGAGREELRFSYMTGGANFSGSQMFKTVPLTDGFVKQFDSLGEPEIIEVDGHKGNQWHPRMNGCGVWNEFFVLSAGDEGLYRTFDYQGWWKATASNCDGDPVLRGHCELIDYELPAGETLRIAPTTTGFYRGDKDDLGNAIGEYIYRYKWDYTRDRYFNRTNLTIWRAAPLTEKVFAMVRAARYCGFERVWVDDFWFDAKGNWRGIFGDDWAEINRYLKRNGLMFRLWMPPWHADRLSDVWLEHPEWMLDFHGNGYHWTIDMSREEAYQWVLNMLCEKQAAFGTYDLRVDGDPCNLQNDGSFDTDNKGSWNATLKQSENFYRLYREFKERNPEAGLDGCSSGGHTLGIESSRYTDQQQITDGWCFHMGGYDTTLLLPIDKHQGMPIAGSRRTDWHAHDESALDLFSAPGGMMQNPEQGYTIEALEGYAGTWSCSILPAHAGRVRPLRKGVPTRNGALRQDIPAAAHHVGRSEGAFDDQRRPVKPHAGQKRPGIPQGLNPGEAYRIEARLGAMEPQTRTGAEWMRDGVWLKDVKPGEYLFINLPDRPGTGAAGAPPLPPKRVTVEPCAWLGHEGLGIGWEAPDDDRMISYYELARDGKPFTKVATGTYYFEEDPEKGGACQVRSVDYDGRHSAWAEAE
jgi:hypothetical protein